MVCAALVACGQSATPVRQPAQGGAEPGPPKTITVAQLNAVRNYGPWDFGNPSGGGASLGEIHTAGLVSEDKQGRIEGRLAAGLPSLDDGSAAVLSDGRLQTTWKLRPNVKWHDGTPLTADDLVFSWQVLTHPELPSGTGQDLRWIDAVAATDPLTFVVTWKTTYYRALSLGHRELWPLPRHLVGEAFASFSGRDAFLATPYFTAEYVHLGPFRLVDFGGGEQQVFERFDDYFLGRPKLSRVVLRTIADQNAIYASLLAGAVDVASERTLSPELFAQLRDQWRGSGDGVVAHRQDNWRFIIVQFGAEWARPIEISRDVRIRRGLLMGFDPVPIREVLFPGFPDTEADSFMLKSDPRAPLVGKPFARYPYDPGRAAQELAAAGWRRGPDAKVTNRGGEPVRIEIRGDQTDATEVALIADFWRQLGIEVTEEIASFTLARDNEYQATFPGLRIRAYRSSAELFPVFDSRQHPTPQNRWQGLNPSHYANPELDGLMDRLYATVGQREQAALLREMGEVLATDLPALPAYFRILMAAARKGIVALDDYGSGTGPGSGPGLLSRHAHLWDRE